jgi:hypothetical protein
VCRSWHRAAEIATPAHQALRLGSLQASLVRTPTSIRQRDSIPFATMPVRGVVYRRAA